jgi:hypothetical protein
MLREALLASGGVWLALPGEDAASPSFGGDLFAPRGTPGVPVCRNVLDGGPGARRIGARDDGAAADWTAASADGDWVALPALGALAPDSHWKRWQRLGNLPAGAKPSPGGAFVRKRVPEGTPAPAPGLGSPAAGLLRAVETPVQAAVPTPDGEALLSSYGFDPATRLNASRAFAGDAVRFAAGRARSWFVADGAGGPPVLVTVWLEDGRGKSRRRAAVVHAGVTGEEGLALALGAAIEAAEELASGSDR